MTRNLLKMWAFIKRDFLSEISYRLAFIMQVRPRDPGSWPARVSGGAAPRVDEIKTTTCTRLTASYVAWLTAQTLRWPPTWPAARRTWVQRCTCSARTTNLWHFCQPRSQPC